MSGEKNDEVEPEDLAAVNEEPTSDPYQGEDWDGVQDSELADD